MNTTYSSLFDTVSLSQDDGYPIAPAVTTKAALESKTVPSMPANLWRHTQNETATESHHQSVVRSVLGMMAALGLGSMAYAVWQTGVLMSGSHLHDAICAFLH